MTNGKPGRPPKEVTFNHGGPVTQAVYDGVKCLMQGGKRWTYAEFNRFSNRWEPEPKILSNLDANTTALAFHAGELKKMLNPIIEQFDKLKGTIESLEKIVKDLKNG